MRITKLGHCCLILEHEGIRILTDPGTFTTEPVKNVTGIDIVLITHEHADHYHAGSIEAVIKKNNPKAIVIGNSAVAKRLSENDIPCRVVGDGESATVGALTVEGFGKRHAPIYQSFGMVENTGYLVANKFYFPGDSFYDPKKPVDILALPVSGPWLKIGEAVDFAKAVKPRVAFGVHDGMIIPGGGGFVTTILQTFLAPEAIEFVPLGSGDSKTF